MMNMADFLWGLLINTLPEAGGVFLAAWWGIRQLKQTTAAKLEEDRTMLIASISRELEQHADLLESYPQHALYRLYILYHTKPEEYYLTTAFENGIYAGLFASLDLELQHSMNNHYLMVTRVNNFLGIFAVEQSQKERKRLRAIIFDYEGFLVESLRDLQKVLNPEESTG